MSPAAVLTATMPVYLTMLTGALARKFGWLKKESDAGIMTLAIRLLFPCLAVERIVGNPALKNGLQVLLAASLGFGLVVVAMFLCYWVTPLLGLKRGEGARTFALCTSFQNYGFVAIPVTEALFGKPLVGVLFTYTLGVEIAMWTAGVGLLTGFGKAPWRHAINPPVLSILVALGLHYAGVGAYIPTMLHTLMGQLGACAVPLCVILIGASIMDLIGEERFAWGTAVSSAVLRQLVLPWTFLLAGMLLPLGTEMKQILSVQAAMPAAVFTMVLTRHYGGHPPTAMLVIVATTVASIFTAPFAIGFAMRWFGI
ncbi:AEC family transporter [Verrucomicrobium sp. BvORR034]|uniref:AEC family transporter n=1 Tax=Verrucomicrobium sp. BvORR034 TaxID=1396418 RepID=UPI00067957FE|nr:AEC family transporter [Verrucomicrobium sp. BvORR034]